MQSNVLTLEEVRFCANCHADECSIALEGMAPQRLEWHLKNWSAWMNADSTRLGYPSRAAGFVAAVVTGDFDAMVETADKRCARAVDALMKDLVPAERAAVAHHYLYAVFRFRGDCLCEYLRQAKGKIARGLVARGIY